MIWLIKWLLFGPQCQHQFKLLHEIKVYETEKASIPLFLRYVLQCEKCGDIRERKVG